MTGDGKVCVLFYMKPLLNFYKGFFGIVVDMRMLCLLPEWLVTFVKKMHETFTCSVLLQYVSGVRYVLRHSVFIRITNC